MESESSSLQWPQPCRHFKFPEIRLATRNFDESLVIGHGGFGKVYKATIHNGSSLVVAAIKRLDSKSDQGADEFWAEVKMLSKLRHCHLVSLIGYCDDGKEMILIYEYMPHGSLEDHLHKHSTHLSWLQRLKLCIGAARGLDYLHTGTGIEFGVIHRDVKSANILLHESWAAKIADFGLSKIGPKDQPLSHVLTLVKGTFGYLDPDYFLTGRLTRKSDVYAFGVVLFEVLCRKRALDVSRDKEEHHSLARWVEDCIKEGTLKHLIDSDIRDQILPKCLKGFVRIAERCLHSSRNHRPTMAEVVVTLESVLALQEKNDNSLQSGSRTILGRMVDMLPFAYNAENSGWVDKNTFGPSTPGVEIVVAVKKTRQESFQGHDEWLGSRAVDCFTEYGEWSRYKLEEVIGTGSSGVVCSAFDTFVGEKVAIKKINDIFEQGFVATRILREILLLRLLRHPDIVEIKHILLPPSRREFSDIYVVFELMESDLHQVIKTNEKLTPEQCRFFLYQLLRGLKYMHSANVFHRDLKPKNILVNADCKVKICDFGIARVVFNDTPTAVCWTDYVATRWYRAPELCGSFFSKYTQAIDTWSIGCIFAELLTGKPLFPGKSVFHQLDLMTDLLGTPSTEAISRIRHEKAMKYLSKMRKKKPIPFSRKFPNADPLALRLLERMLAFDPNNRPTAEEALSDPYFKNLGKVERESSSRPIAKREFEFEKRRLSTEDIRERIYKEILEYHPNMLKDGSEQPGFMYPSAFDKFKKQFSDKEEHYSKGKVAAPLLRRQSLSLPRASILYPKETTQTSSIKESRTQCMTSEMPNSIPLLQFPQVERLNKAAILLRLLDSEAQNCRYKDFLKAMEDSITQFCDGVARFCNHLESSSAALLQSVNRRSIPFDSASLSFVQCLNRRVSTATSDLNLLESMSFDTVSFEELLGHCNEVYKNNQNQILQLEDHLSAFGYVPEVEIDEPEDDFIESQPNTSLDFKNTMEDDSLFEDTLSLQNLGISNASLATIVSEGKNKIDMNGLYEPAMDTPEVENEQNELKPFEDSKSLICVGKVVYESLPSYMKSLASWEDLIHAVEKMNLSLETKNGNFFTQDEVSLLELGHKTRSYLLLLVKMNCIVVETIDGLISYRVL
ncbi:unnamed protein product [Lactuca saligna]|uniref:Mitogen-activated protein kinase n=1 Tax=Lactuca saligna TaxID=75948 RepID=A0AA35V0M8_LACSI|nr:unnamed protein product [Lactuca saligna]